MGGRGTGTKIIMKLVLFYISFLLKKFFFIQNLIFHFFKMYFVH